MSQYKTLSDIKSIVTDRLGLSFDQLNDYRLLDQINAIIAHAQEALWFELDLDTDRVVPYPGSPVTFSTVAGTNAYAYPADCDRSRINAVFIFKNGEWNPLEEALNDDWATLFGGSDLPTHYRRSAQLILMPTPTEVHSVKIDYFNILGRLLLDTDLVTMPPRLVIAKAMVDCVTSIAAFSHINLDVLLNDLEQAKRHFLIANNGNQRFICQ